MNFGKRQTHENKKENYFKPTLNPTQPNPIIKTFYTKITLNQRKTNLPQM